MKQRILSLLVLFCLLLSLAACGGGASSAEGSASVPEETAGEMTEEEYKSEVKALSSHISSAITSMNGLSDTDEGAFRDGIAAIRTMVESLRSFSDIPNPPETWAAAHAKIAEGCGQFADVLEGLCDSGENMLDGKVTEESYNSSVAECTAGLAKAAVLLNEGLGMIQA